MGVKGVDAIPQDSMDLRNRVLCVILLEVVTLATLLMTAPGKETWRRNGNLLMQEAYQII